MFLVISDWGISCFGNVVANWLSSISFLLLFLLIIVTGVDSLGLFGVFEMLGLFCFEVIPPPFGFWLEGILLGVTGSFGLFGMQFSSFGISSIFGIIIFKCLLQFSPYSGSSNAHEPVGGHPGTGFEFTISK